MQELDILKEMVNDEIQKTERTIYTIVSQSEEIEEVNGNIVANGKPRKFSLLRTLYNRLEELKRLKRSFQYYQGIIFEKNGKKYLLAPDGAGGHKFEYDGETIITVSESSPLGREVMLSFEE